MRLPSHTPLAHARPADAGFSVIEVIIAMAVLGLMSIALVPAMLTAIQVSTTNREQVAATTYANAQLASLRQQLATNPTRTCDAIAADAAGLSVAKDALIATVTITRCPPTSDRPGTVAVSVGVAASKKPTAPLTVLNSEILVKAA